MGDGGARGTATLRRGALCAFDDCENSTLAVRADGDAVCADCLPRLQRGELP